MKTNAPQFLFCMGDFHGAKALQVGTNRGGMGDDKSSFSIRQTGQNLADTSRHPSIDFTERFSVWVFEIGIFVLPLPEREILSRGVTGLSFKKPRVRPNRSFEKIGSLESTLGG